VVGSCEYRNEPVCSVEDVNFLTNKKTVSFSEADGVGWLLFVVKKTSSIY